MPKTMNNTCKFFVQRKKRYCKMLVKPGKDLCGEHQKPFQNTDLLNLNPENATGIRIVCPLDPKHTVYAQNLTKHLKICNARPNTLEPYIQKNINSGESADSSSSSINPEEATYQILSTFSTEKILKVIQTVNNIYDEETIKITDKKLSFQSVEDEILQNPEYGEKTLKHLKQSSAIVGLLKENNLLKSNKCYIEFGAGRGQLSCWIAQATESLKNCKILLIEKASPKHKRDNKLARISDQIKRIRADIADLVLDKLDLIENRECVGVTKHLCGGATDLAIRCMLNSKNLNEKNPSMVLTFCCHHRCRWTSYTGKKFFQENNLNIEDFNVVCCLTSWATCGSGFSREYREKRKIEEFEDAQKYGFNRSEREEIGRKCKNIINWGRLKYLNEFNYECSLHYYVDKNVTLENVCIVAIKKS